MNLHRLDLVSLALFNFVVSSGSISKGAQQASLAVAAASKRIADLEDAVGAILLERHSRGVSPTPAGAALHRHAQRVLGDVDLLAAELSDYAAGVAGVIRLWANTSAITQFLPAELASFTACHPDLRIELEEQNSDQIALAVLNGHADFGILADSTPTPGLQTKPYRQDRLALVVPGTHPLAGRDEIGFADALDYDFVCLPRQTSLARRLEQATTTLGARLKLRIQVRSFDAMCLMVAAGHGVAVLPERAAQPHLRSMGLSRIALRDAWSRRELLICARDLHALPRPARLLADHLLALAV